MGNKISVRYENAKKTGSLQLSGLKLTKVPDDIRGLNSLRILDLSDNSIQNVEPWIGILTSLKVLNLRKNKLRYLPSEISCLSKLETLDVSNNRLISLTPDPSGLTFASMQNLRSVNLSNNEIREFPLELCAKEIPLDVLDLSKNCIVVVPDCTSALQVTELNLNENQIKTVSESLAKCPRLKVLRLTHNFLQLDGFPMTILENSTVSLINLEGNPLSLRALQETPAYSKYMERYTAAKRKAIP